MTIKKFNQILSVFIAVAMLCTQVIPYGFADLIEADEIGQEKPLIPVEEVVIEEETETPSGSLMDFTKTLELVREIHENERQEPVLPLTDVTLESKPEILIANPETDSRKVRIDLLGNLDEVTEVAVAVNRLDKEGYKQVFELKPGQREIWITIPPQYRAHWINVSMRDASDKQIGWDYGKVTRVKPQETIFHSKQIDPARIGRFRDVIEEMQGEDIYFRYGINSAIEDEEKEMMKYEEGMSLKGSGRENERDWANFWMYKKNFESGEYERIGYFYHPLRFEKVKVDMSVAGDAPSTQDRAVTINFSSTSHDLDEKVKYVQFANGYHGKKTGMLNFATEMTYELPGARGFTKWVTAFLYDDDQKLIGVVYKPIDLEEKLPETLRTPEPKVPFLSNLPKQVQTREGFLTINEDLTAELRRSDGSVERYKNIQAIERQRHCSRAPGLVVCMAVDTGVPAPEGTEFIGMMDYVEYEERSMERWFFGEKMEEPFLTNLPKDVQLDDGVLKINEDLTGILRYPDGRKVYYKELRVQEGNSISCGVEQNGTMLCARTEMGFITPDGFEQIGVFDDVDETGLGVERLIYGIFEKSELPNYIVTETKNIQVDVDALVARLEELMNNARQATGQICFEGCGTVEDLYLLEGIKQFFSKEDLMQFETNLRSPALAGADTFSDKGWVDFVRELLERIGNPSSKEWNAFYPIGEVVDLNIVTDLGEIEGVNLLGDKQRLAVVFSLNVEGLVDFLVTGDLKLDPYHVIEAAREKIKMLFNENKIESPINLSDFEASKQKLDEVWQKAREILRDLQIQLLDLGWGQPVPIEITPYEGYGCDIAEECDLDIPIAMNIPPTIGYREIEWPKSARALEVEVISLMRVMYENFLQSNLRDGASGLLIPLKDIVARFQEEYREFQQQSLPTFLYDPNVLLDLYGGLSEEMLPGQFNFGRSFTSYLFTEVPLFHSLALAIANAPSNEQVMNMMVAFFRTNRDLILSARENEFDIDRFFEILKGIPEPEYPTSLHLKDLGLIISGIDMPGLIKLIEEARREAERLQKMVSDVVYIEGHGPESLLFLKGVADVFTLDEIMAFERENQGECYATYDGLQMCHWSSATPQFSKQGWIDFTTELIRRYAERDLDIYVELVSALEAERDYPLPLTGDEGDSPLMALDSVTPTVLTFRLFSPTKLMEIVKEGVEKREDPTIAKFRAMVTRDLSNLIHFSDERIESLIKEGKIQLEINEETKQVHVKFDESIRGNHFGPVQIVEHIGDPLGSSKLPETITYQLSVSPIQPAVACVVGEDCSRYTAYQINSAVYDLEELRYELNYIPGAEDLETGIVPMLGMSAGHPISGKVISNYGIVCITTPCPSNILERSLSYEYSDDGNLQKIVVLYNKKHDAEVAAWRASGHSEPFVGGIASREITLDSDGMIERIVAKRASGHVVNTSEFVYLEIGVLAPCVPMVGVECDNSVQGIIKNFSHIERTDAEGNALSSVWIEPLDVAGAKYLKVILRFPSGEEVGILNDPSFGLEGVLRAVRDAEMHIMEKEALRLELLEMADSKISEIEAEIKKYEERLAQALIAVEERIDVMLEEYEQGMTELGDILQAITEFLETADLTVEGAAPYLSFLDEVAAFEATSDVDQFIEFMRTSATLDARAYLSHYREYLGRLNTYRAEVELASSIDVLTDLKIRFPEPKVIVMPGMALFILPHPLEGLRNLIEKGRELMEGIYDPGLESFREKALLIVDQELMLASDKIAELEGLLELAKEKLRQYEQSVRADIDVLMSEFEGLIERIRLFDPSLDPDKLAPFQPDSSIDLIKVVTLQVEHSLLGYLSRLESNVKRLTSQLGEWTERKAQLENVKAAIKMAVSVDEIDQLLESIKAPETSEIVDLLETAEIELAGLVPSLALTSALEGASVISFDPREFLRAVNAYLKKMIEELTEKEAVESLRAEILANVNSKIEEVNQDIASGRVNLENAIQRVETLMQEMELKVEGASAKLREVIAAMEALLEVAGLDGDVLSQMKAFVEEAKFLLDSGLEGHMANYKDEISRTIKFIQSHLEDDEEYLEELLRIKSEVEAASSLNELELLALIPVRLIPTAEIAVLPVIFPSVYNPTPAQRINDLIARGERLIEEVDGNSETNQLIKNAQYEIEQILQELRIREPILMTEASGIDELYEDVRARVKGVLSELALKLKALGWGTHKSTAFIPFIELGTVEWPGKAIELEIGANEALRQAYRDLAVLSVSDNEHDSAVLHLEKLIYEFEKLFPFEIVDRPAQLLELFPGLTEGMIPTQWDYPPFFSLNHFNENPYLMYGIAYEPKPSVRQIRDMLIAFYESVRDEVLVIPSEDEWVLVGGDMMVQKQPFIDEGKFWSLLTGDEAAALEMQRARLLDRISETRQDFEAQIANAEKELEDILAEVQEAISELITQVDEGKLSLLSLVGELRELMQQISLLGFGDSSELLQTTEAFIARILAAVEGEGDDSLDSLAELFATSITQQKTHEKEFWISQYKEFLSRLDSYEAQVLAATSLDDLIVLSDEFPQMYYLRYLMDFMMVIDPRDLIRELLAEGDSLIEKLKQALLNREGEVAQMTIDSLIKRIAFAEVNPDDVEVLSIERGGWSSGCMGWDYPSSSQMMCTMSMVEGYVVKLKLYGNTYEFRTGGARYASLDPMKDAALLAMEDAVVNQGADFSTLLISGLKVVEKKVNQAILAPEDPSYMVDEYVFNPAAGSLGVPDYVWETKKFVEVYLLAGDVNIYHYSVDYDTKTVELETLIIMGNVEPEPEPVCEFGDLSCGSYGNCSDKGMEDFSSTNYCFDGNSLHLKPWIVGGETNSNESIPGDANGDGVVNDVDKAIVTMYWQQEVTGGASQGDFDGNGVVSLNDFQILSSNWQKGELKTPPPAGEDWIDGDANGDGIVNDVDKAIVSMYWQQEVTGGASMGDMDGNGVVSLNDLQIVASNWSKAA